jgi:poly(A) polymerase
MSGKLTKIVKKMLGRGEKKQHLPLSSGEVSQSANIIPRTQHNISRAAIPENALKVLYGLKKAGYGAFLVGGCVRDLLMGKIPKDFDIATNANPEEVRKIFRNCILIGRRFRLAHIRYGKEVYEVATFRARLDNTHPEFKHNKGMILRDNVYGTMEEDAFRRDFTINALYYNIKDFSVVDYCGGMKDIQERNLRMIGDPRERYHEDPVRLLRAIRFAAKLELHIEHETSKPIFELGGLLAHVPSARLFDETLKLLLGGESLATFQLLREYNLFNQLFPQTAACLEQTTNKIILKFINQGFKNTDERIAAGKSINPAFILSVLLWYPLQTLINQQKPGNKNNIPIQTVLDKASQALLSHQIQRTSIPRRLSLIMREIWLLQYHFKRRTERFALHLLQHRRFRAAYDFLLLRAEAGEDVGGLDSWWTAFMDGNDEQRKALLESVPQIKPKKRRRRSRPKTKKSESTVQ